TFLAKGKYPVIPYNDRVQIIESINVVDSVILHDADSFEDSAFVDYTLKKQKELKFDIIFKGSDAQGTQKWIMIEKELSKIGVQVIFFPYTVTISSTLITQKLLQY
ncbi:hypothetical protein H7169_01315, partial [Candidatus Gracilibacteria bacterium]|nr:hypothetical protein [Candidatus Gracilibacteria bacterium]